MVMIAEGGGGRGPKKSGGSLGSLIGGAVRANTGTVTKAPKPARAPSGGRSAPGVGALPDRQDFGTRTTDWHSSISKLFDADKPEEKEPDRVLGLAKKSDPDAVVARPAGARPEITMTLVPGPGGMMLVPETNQTNVEYNQNLLDRAAREKALNTGLAPGRRPAGPAKPGVVKQMSWEEYQGLTERQRAAVDFNSLLVSAVRKDQEMNRTGGYKDAAPEERATYDRAVDKMFGHDRGSETYAPETMAVLDQIKLKDTGADLDDFLELKAAITSEDLPELKMSAGPRLYTGMDEPQKDRLELVEQLAEKTYDMQHALAKGNKMLQSFRETTTAERNKIVGLYGGTPSPVTPALGFGQGQFDAQGVPQDANAYFQLQFDRLADAAGDAAFQGNVLAEVEEALEPAELQAFYNYLDTRSSTAARFGTSLGKGEGVQYRTPQEFREMLGIGKGGE